jgi:hypothetical protein
MTDGERWIKLLGYYAVHEDGAAKAIYHERLVRCVAELGIPPLEFIHPAEGAILALFENGKVPPNAILCGEAGVGKTRIVHKIFEKINGDPALLQRRDKYWCCECAANDGTRYKVHINRDLSAWRDLGAKRSSNEQAVLIERWSRLLMGERLQSDMHEFFVIAANDGQLLKAWQDHSDSPVVAKAFSVLSDCLRNGKQPEGHLPLRLFHLSEAESATIMRLCIDAFVKHPGWKSLEEQHSGPKDLYCEDSPLRRHRCAFQDPIVCKRFEDLAALCQANDWHLPIRNILAVLANAVLGVNDAATSKTGVMDATGIRKLLAESRSDRSNFFENILGLNLAVTWRERTLGALESFRIGLETTKQADSLILFGPEAEYGLRKDHERIFHQDPVFPYDSNFEKIRRDYLNTGSNESDRGRGCFHEDLVAQRRRLFFRTPIELEDTYNPWGLTNFQYAKEYLEQILAPVRTRNPPHPRHLASLILGLNRVWSGLLLDEKDTLFLTTALDLANSRSAEIEVRRVHTKAATGGECPFVGLELGPLDTFVPRIAVHLREDKPPVTLALTLTRFEFLKRVAAGALPASFSRECAEDIRAFKSKILAQFPAPPSGNIRLLRVNPDGTAGTANINLS